MYIFFLTNLYLKQDMLLFQYLYKNSYYLQQFKDLIICIVVVTASLLICQQIKTIGVVGIIIKLIVATIVTLIVEIGTYYRTDEFKLLKSKLKLAVNKS